MNKLFQSDQLKII